MSFFFIFQKSQKNLSKKYQQITYLPYTRWRTYLDSLHEKPLCPLICKYEIFVYIDFSLVIFFIRLYIKKYKNLIIGQVHNTIFYVIISLKYYFKFRYFKI